MKIRTTVVLSLLALLFALAVPVLAQDKAQQEMEAAMMKAMTPGEPQQHLARLAGDWTYTSKMWMAPGQPSMDAGGTMHAEVLLGGRYVEHRWNGTMMGMPFEGRGTEAYDNTAKKYFSSWIDNMGTGIMYSIGTCDEAGKSCTYNADIWDPMSGQKTTIRQVTSWLDNNTYKLEMYGNDPSGKEMKMVEITAKRK